MSSTTDDTTTTARKAVEQYLRDNRGNRYTVAELADAIGYSRTHVRGVAKTLVDEGVISGQKNQRRRVPAYIIDGDYRVVVDREPLLDLVKTHAPSHYDRLKDASLDTIQKFVRSTIADDTAAGDAMWEFWLPTDST